MVGTRRTLLSGTKVIGKEEAWRAKAADVNSKEVEPSPTVDEAQSSHPESAAVLHDLCDLWASSAVSGSSRLIDTEGDDVLAVLVELATRQLESFAQLLPVLERIGVVSWYLSF